MSASNMWIGVLDELHTASDSDNRIRGNTFRNDVSALDLLTKKTSILRIRSL